MDDKQASELLELLKRYGEECVYGGLGGQDRSGLILDKIEAILKRLTKGPKQ